MANSGSGVSHVTLRVCRVLKTGVSPATDTRRARSSRVEIAAKPPAGHRAGGDHGLGGGPKISMPYELAIAARAAGSGGTSSGGVEAAGLTGIPAARVNLSKPAGVCKVRNRPAGWLPQRRAATAEAGTRPHRLPRRAIGRPHRRAVRRRAQRRSPRQPDAGARDCCSPAHPRVPISPGFLLSRPRRRGRESAPRGTTLPAAHLGSDRRGAGPVGVALKRQCRFLPQAH
jgi:hypothetical protein